MSKNDDSITIEIWKDIPNFNGYQASTLGAIKSIDRKIIKSDGVSIRRKGMQMKLTKRRNIHGRETFYVTLCISGKQITRGVSTLIAETFLVKPINSSIFSLQVGHQDGNPLNNSLPNLKWETPAENMQHAHKTGLIVYEKGGKHFNAKKIIQLTMDGIMIKNWNSVTEAAQELKIRQENIATCARGKKMSAGGFKWKYTTEFKSDGIVNPNEIWRNIPHTNDEYQVSNLGRIRSVNRTVKRTDGFDVKYKSKILRQSILNGYCSILLSGIKKRFFVHIIVAEVFIGKRPSIKYIVDHKDDDKKNNKVINLQWITRQENIQKAYNTNVASQKKGGEHYSSQPIDQFEKNGKFIKTWDCTADVCRFLNKNTVNNIYGNLRGTRKSAYGFIWKYAKK
jgi:hypothetical protein